jgi:hypothetical protein
MFSQQEIRTIEYAVALRQLADPLRMWERRWLETARPDCPIHVASYPRKADASATSTFTTIVYSSTNSVMQC